ncbi:unnamed protein product [Debaryomyces tyrocola]|nr:unnamed protein product [Debaryomyces tyrocola]
MICEPRSSNSNARRLRAFPSIPWIDHLAASKAISVSEQKQISLAKDSTLDLGVLVPMKPCAEIPKSQNCLPSK